MKAQEKWEERMVAAAAGRLAKFYLSSRESYSARHLADTLGWDRPRTRAAIRRATSSGTLHPYVPWGKDSGERFGRDEAEKFLRENADCGVADLIELVMAPPSLVWLPTALVWEMLLAASSGKWIPSEAFVNFRYPVERGAYFDA
jgi:hypothetical protein